MFEKRTLRRITTYVLAASAALTAITFVFGGAWMGFGAAIGGAFGVANWMLTRWVGRRILVAGDSVAGDRGRAIWGSMLALKMMLVFAAIWIVLSTQWVDPMGFAVGLSGLVLGALAGAYHSAVSGEARSAKEGS